MIPEYRSNILRNSFLDIKYEKLEILIHPESLVHSIIEFNDYTSNFNYFYHDMFIPIFNFLNTYWVNPTF